MRKTPYASRWVSMNDAVTSRGDRVGARDGARVQGRNPRGGPGLEPGSLTDGAPGLSEDGSVRLHLDDTQMHHARWVLDKVFGDDPVAGCDAVLPCSLRRRSSPCARNRTAT